MTEDAPEIVSGFLAAKACPSGRSTWPNRRCRPRHGARLYWVYDEKDDDGNPIDHISSDYAKASTSKWYHGNRIPDL